MYIYETKYYSSQFQKKFLFFLPLMGNMVDACSRYLYLQEHQWCNNCKDHGEVNFLMPKMSNIILCMAPLLYLIPCVHIYLCIVYHLFIMAVNDISIFAFAVSVQPLFLFSTIV